MTSPLPRFVALCGNPLSGKSTAGLILEKLGYGLVDDGGPMRQIAINQFGATHDDVYTQEGKLRTTVVNGVTMTWRDVLGRIGNGLEHEFGGDVSDFGHGRKGRSQLRPAGVSRQIGLQRPSRLRNAL